jgi:hypothetical protein
MRSAPSSSSGGHHAGSSIEPTPNAHTAVCSGCAAIYPLAIWTSLSLVQSIDASEIATLVRDWPEGVAIEVRRCSRCGGSIARKRPAAM